MDSEKSIFVNPEKDSLIYEIFQKILKEESLKNCTNLTKIELNLLKFDGIFLPKNCFKKNNKEKFCQKKIWTEFKQDFYKTINKFANKTTQLSKVVSFYFQNLFEKAV